MRFKRYGEPREDLTERLRPLQKANEFIFERLNAHFDFLLATRPELVVPFGVELESCVDSLGVQPRCKEDASTVAMLSQHHVHLAPRQELTRRCLDVFCLEKDMGQAINCTNRSLLRHEK